mmetsp:Transcript_5921/g.9674  ORF Transcript_5921/g.9674 Transcript_5921/m.9674 type:complete len:96 (+) Transcript_5921:364-651(+)
MALRKVFGDQIWNSEEQTIDSAKLGEIIFNDRSKRRQLDKMTHSRIFRKIFGLIWRERVIKGNTKVVLDAPLLYETRVLEYLCHPIACVYVNKDT